MDANAAAPQPAQPQQASPIAVGNYQMPRIGPAAAFDLPAGTLDPNTGEHVAPAPAAAPLQQPTQPAAPSFLDTARGHLDASAQSMSHGGGLIGGITSLITGQRHDPQAQFQADQAAQQQKQAQQESAALVALGVPQQRAVQLATIHAIDKEAGRALIEKEIGPQTVQSLGNGYIWDSRQNKAVKAYEPDDKNKLVKIGQDGLGREQYGVFNPSDGTIKPYNAPGGDTGNDGIPGDTSLTGKEYLASLPSAYRAAGQTAQAVAEGTQPKPTYGSDKPYWRTVAAIAKQYDPTFDQTNWSARVAGMKSFKSGADAGTVRSANQVLGHISDLTDKADELHNGNFPLVNWVGNQFNQATGGDASNNWVTQAHAVADELSSFMKGAGHSSDTEIQQWKESLSPNMSPQQQRGAIKTLMGIYDHALSALEDKRTGAIGSVAAEKMGPLVTPAGQGAMNKVRAWAAGSAPGAPAASGTAPTGVKWSVVQ